MPGRTRRAAPCSVRIDELLCRAPILACYRSRSYRDGEFLIAERKCQTNSDQLQH